MPRFARYVIAVALLGLLGASPQSVGAQTLSPGAEVFAVDPAKVIEVTYRSPGMMLIAHRWQTRDRFTLIILDQQHRKPVIGLAGQGFDVVLNQLTSLKLRRALNAKEAKELLQKNPVSLWTEVVVRDHTALEPFRALVMPVSGVPNEAFVHFNGVTYVVDFADRVLQLISGGCNLLATPSPNQE
jgi:hypothetical protein